MNVEKAKRAVHILAEREGVPEEQILEEINRTIARSVQEAKKRNKEEMLLQWREIAAGQELPDAYTLIAYVADRIEKSRVGVAAD